MTTTLDAPDTYLTSVLRADTGPVDDRARIGKDLVGAALGAALYGLGLASFSATPMQLLASALKVPVLLLGAALLCFPTFHLVQAACSQSPLPSRQALRILSTSLAATGLTWAALCPPVLFLVTTSHDYVLARVIAVLVGAVGGLVGLSRFRSLLKANRPQPPARAERWALRLHGLLFSVVGVQLAWVLRPFIGSPLADFTWFRALGTTPLTLLFGS